MPHSGLPRIVIVGGGFGGIELIRKLRESDFEVVMLDRNNYHSFIPLLYQVATAGLSPGDISSPLREFLQDDDHFHFRLAEVLNIEGENNVLHTSLGPLHYDHLIIATGSRTNFFGNHDLESNSLKLREINDAINLRNRMIENFEEALLIKDEDERNRYLKIIIVGAGPTGVELAGAIGELRDHVLPKDYPELDFSQMEIYLIEGSDRVLSAMSKSASRNSQKYLSDFKINVLLGTRVESFRNGVVKLHNGDEIQSNCLIWAAGVEGNLIEGLPTNSIEKNRIAVDEHNRVIGFKNIYAIGDVAFQTQPGFENGLPMLAPVAIQQARMLGKNLKRSTRSENWKPFRYIDKGTMATIGRNRAVVDAPLNIKFSGFFGWFVWMFIHLLSIIGFRRKILVFSNWVWNYLTYNRGNRLIIERKTDDEDRNRLHTEVL